MSLILLQDIEAMELAIKILELFPCRASHGKPDDARKRHFGDESGCFGGEVFQIFASTFEVFGKRPLCEKFLRENPSIGGLPCLHVHACDSFRVIHGRRAYLRLRLKSPCHTLVELILMHSRKNIPYE